MRASATELRTSFHDEDDAFERAEILERVALDRSPFSCMLGGPDGRTLYILAAEWRGPEQIEEAIADRTGQVLVADAPAPHAGWP